MDLAAMEELCDRWLAAWSTGPAERLASFYAPDSYYEDPARPNGLRGREALQPYLAKLLALNPGWQWTRKSLHPVEGGFVLRHEARIPVGEGPDLVERCMDLVLLDDKGLIAHNEVYFDRSRWMEHLKARVA